MQSQGKNVTQHQQSQTQKKKKDSGSLTQLHSEWPKLYGVLTILSAIGLRDFAMTENFSLKHFAL